MSTTAVDRAIVIATLVTSFIPAIAMARRAVSSTAEFFTSGPPDSVPHALAAIARLVRTA